MKTFRLPGETHIGYAHLQISDLKRSLHFYQHLVGTKTVSKFGMTAAPSASGSGSFHVLLTERPGARPKPPRSTGLYHIAIRYSSRRELARAFRRLHDDGVAFQGFSDHLVSEAIYLADPDGNGVELYVDRPREQWTVQEDQIQMATLPLDMENLLRELPEADRDDHGADPLTDMGHVHLHVSDLEKAESFYHSLLGFDITQRSYPGALFLSAGGYHHHIGLNIWAGKGALPPPPDAVGLMSFGIELPDRTVIEVLKQRLAASTIEFELKQLDVINGEVLRVKDPDGIKIEFFSKT